jgi:hypothetical protein
MGKAGMSSKSRGLRGAKTRVLKRIKSVTTAEWALDLTGSTALELIVGQVFNLPVGLQLVLWPLFVASGAFLIVVIREQRTARVTRAVARIRALAEDINISGFGIEPSIMIGPIRNPLTEAAVELKAICKPEIAITYERCLLDREPEVAAKRFLLAIADTLGPDDLRS